MRSLGTTRLPAVFAIIALLASSVGCTGRPVQFVDAGRSYTASTVDDLIANTSSGGLAAQKTEDAPALRQRALVSLRRASGRAPQAAELLTAIFPASTTAVPYYVERATYEGTDAWIVLEARGRPGGTLADRRLWVIDTTGNVMVSKLR